MKKIITLIFVMLIAITSYAQVPFTIYQSAPIPPPSSYSLPDISFPDPVDDLIRYNAAKAAADSRAMEIVSSDIIDADGLNLVNGAYSPLKVKIIQRRNGLTQFFCLGIKKNGKWSNCEQEIASLEKMHKKATKESDKNMILELMEYGNYLLIINPEEEVYIIK